MRATFIASAMLAAAGLGACDSTDHVAGSPTPATRGILTSSSDAGALGSPAPEPYANVALPDEADFAPEAEREITKDNYRDKIDELEKELADAGPADPLPSSSARPPATSSAAAQD